MSPFVFQLAKFRKKKGEGKPSAGTRNENDEYLSDAACSETSSISDDEDLAKVAKLRVQI